MMQITVTFSSLEEFDAFRGARIAPAPVEEPVLVAAPVKESDAVPEYSVVPPEALADAATPAAPKEHADYDELRVAIRKELAALNKQLGRNVAKELISQFGVSRLTEVPDEDLPELQRRAKEAANA